MKIAAVDRELNTDQKLITITTYFAKTLSRNYYKKYFHEL